MLKRIVTIVLILASLVGGMAAIRVQVTLAQDPTIPTRTPTPDPNQPTRTNPTATATDSGDPGNPPTDTPVPGQTGTVEPDASATLTGIIQSPAAGSLTPGTAVGIAQSGIGAANTCDDTPYVRATKRLAVYAGPGGNYEILATLEIDERRLILGRAGFADWWQIQVSPGMVGWVDDEDVSEFGNTALVMIVNPPAINGVNPTPGPAWNPTPLPFPTCAPTPTPSPTPTASPGPTGSATITGGGTTTGDQPTMAAPDAVVAEVTRDTAAEAETGASGLGVSSRGTEAGRAASPTSVTNLVLPLGGLALIGAGIALALLSRNRGGTPTDTGSTSSTDSPK